MYCEAEQAAQVVREQIAANAERLERLGERLRQLAPRAVVTCARGSSDHAATFAKYLIETRLNVLTSSAAPSVSSVYDSTPNLAGTVFLAISQSGASPDLLATVRAAKAAGALVVATGQCRILPSRAHRGFYRPAVRRHRAQRSRDEVIYRLAVRDHPTRRELGTRCAAARDATGCARDFSNRPGSWTGACRSSRLKLASDLYVLGRGLGLGVAQEAALKFKETCGLHAEAVSSAEVRHGPMALIRAGFPVLMFAQDDETRAGVESLATELAARRADVMMAGAKVPRALILPTQTANPVLQPMLIVQSFYRMVNALSLARDSTPTALPI